MMPVNRSNANGGGEEKRAPAEYAFVEGEVARIQLARGEERSLAGNIVTLLRKACPAVRVLLPRRMDQNQIWLSRVALMSSLAALADREKEERFDITDSSSAPTQAFVVTRQAARV